MEAVEEGLPAGQDSAPARIDIPHKLFSAKSGAGGASEACQAISRNSARREPGGGRVVECLAKQLDKLTPECKAVVEAHMPK